MQPIAHWQISRKQGANWTVSTSDYRDKFIQSNLQLTPMQLRFIELQGFLNRLLLKKFNVRKTFGLTKLITQNGHTVDCSTCLKMLLNFLRGYEAMSNATQGYDRPCDDSEKH
ncbi:riboflavin kinase [Striga asiatica]|uniref:Riboflavin kinase n=1 Tax=Striga asiatica TaxID=4170 RepID=A0A5A7QC55_STRAF|nr:riboflavin kinase [Striga asiatica]